VVDFVREPTNPYDKLACQAIVAGSLVGYLSRDAAAKLATQVDAAGVTAWQVAGVVVGGTYEAAHLGVHVWLDQRLTDGPFGPVTGSR
jgi:HIRAN domain